MSNDTEYDVNNICACRGHSLDYCPCTVQEKERWLDYYRYHEERKEENERDANNKS